MKILFTIAVLSFAALAWAAFAIARHVRRSDAPPLPEFTGADSITTTHRPAKRPVLTESR